MKKLINSLKKLEKENSNIYCGKGVFAEFTIDLKSGISEKEVSARGALVWQILTALRCQWRVTYCEKITKK